MDLPVRKFILFMGDIGQIQFQPNSNNISNGALQGNNMSWQNNTVPYGEAHRRHHFSIF